MEHHLGMTCDPVGGLVQIPCIRTKCAWRGKSGERGAHGDDFSEHKVSLDQVIQTMYQTASDMQTRYKETALGGTCAQRDRVLNSITVDVFSEERRGPLARIVLFLPRLAIYEVAEKRSRRCT